VTRTRPPFRADHVGSLLRPASLKQARARSERGEISAADLAAAEDAAIQDVIAKQALNYLRVAGESWPLTRERMRSESQAMQTYARIAVSAVIPRFWWSISLTRVAGMCVSFARRYPVTDSGFRNSSSRISPG